MVLTKDQENFMKFTQVIVDVIPKYLRELFIRLWNDKFRETPWNSDSVSGERLWSAVPPEIQCDKQFCSQNVREKIQSGKEDSWDATLLIFLLLRAKLNLMENCRPIRKPPLRKSEMIDNLRVMRNNFFAHASSTTLSFTDFQNKSMNLKIEVRNVFGNDAVSEIDEILKSDFETQLTVSLNERLYREIQFNQNLEEKLEGASLLLFS